MHRVTLVLISLLAVLARAEQPARFDNPFTIRETVRTDPGARLELDFTTFRQGDYSLRLRNGPAPGVRSLTFAPGPGLGPWRLAPEGKLVVTLRAPAPEAGAWELRWTDRNRRTAHATQPVSGKDWHEVAVPLDRFTCESSFDWTAVMSLQIRGTLPEQGSLWVDDLRVTDPAGATLFGISDKSIAQQRQEAEQSRQRRVELAYSKRLAPGLREGLSPLFVRLARGDDLPAANAELIEALTTRDPARRDYLRLDDLWCLVTNQTLYRMYYAYGSKGRVAAGRLTPEAELVLLEELWRRTLEKNDIALARQSTWWMAASENHDIVAKTSSLLTSQIFARDPRFANRELPDRGEGGGKGFWFSSLYGGGDQPGPHGRGKFADGHKYSVSAHEAAWTAFWREYFAERARRGFFLEHGSPNYGQTTISYLYDIAELAEDAALREQATRFLDLCWAEWAQDQLVGFRGGARTRVSSPYTSRDFLREMAEFEFGGPAFARSHHFSLHTGGYRIPELIWEMAVDRQGLGEFGYTARIPGEANPRWPQPPGTERTLLCDTESRFVRESWVTPDYVLGTQMDHPGAVHSHLSIASRSQGMLFTGERNLRVFTSGFKEAKSPGKFDVAAAYFRSVQSGRVAIMQEARSFMQVSPDWFPAQSFHSPQIGVGFTATPHRLVERQGWLFVEEGNAFLAIKPILSEFHEGFVLLKDRVQPGPPPVLAGAYKWSDDRRAILFTDRYSAVIFEASRRLQHADLETFIADVLDNPLELVRTVVPGYNVVRYRGCGTDAASLELNAASTEIPRINGAYVNYACPAFSSPSLHGEYGSGVVTVRKGAQSLRLDLNPAGR